MEKQNVKEKWLPVAGYEGRYEVSDQGRVRSIRTKRGKKVRYVLKPFTSEGWKDKRCPQLRYMKYHQVYIYKDGKRRIFLIHRLVAAAFLPAPEPGLQIDHINGDKYDNRAANLHWITASENHRKSTAASRSNKYLYTLSLKYTMLTYSSYSISDVADRIPMDRKMLDDLLRRHGCYENDFLRVTRQPKENAKKNDR